MYSLKLCREFKVFRVNSFHYFFKILIFLFVSLY